MAKEAGARQSEEPQRKQREVLQFVGMLAVGIALFCCLLAMMHKMAWDYGFAGAEGDTYLAPPPPYSAHTVKEAQARVAVSPFSAQAHYDLGMEYYTQKNFAGAILELRLAVSLSPEGVSKEAYFYLAFASEAVGDRPAAYRVVQRLLTMRLSRNEESRAQLMMGSRNLDEHHDASAEMHFRASLTADPRNGGAMYGIAVIENRQGNVDGAIKYLMAAIHYAQYNRSAATAHDALGQVFEMRGELVEAKREYASAIRCDGGYAQARTDQERITRTFPEP